MAPHVHPHGLAPPGAHRHLGHRLQLRPQELGRLVDHAAASASRCLRYVLLRKFLHHPYYTYIHCIESIPLIHEPFLKKLVLERLTRALAIQRLLRAGAVPVLRNAEGVE